MEKPWKIPFFKPNWPKMLYILTVSMFLVFFSCWCLHIISDLSFFILFKLIFILQKSFLLHYCLILQNKHSCNTESIENSGLSYFLNDRDILKEVLMWCEEECVWGNCYFLLFLLSFLNISIFLLTFFWIWAPELWHPIVLTAMKSGLY